MKYKTNFTVYIFMQILSCATFAQGLKCELLFSENFKSEKVQHKMNNLKIAAVQFPLSEAKTSNEFLNKMKLLIDEAHTNGAQAVVFPELITTELIDWSKPDEKLQLEAIAKNFTPQYIEWLKNQSKTLKISILGGTTPRIIDGKIFNTAVLTLPDGSALLQDKIFLTPDEKKWNWHPGTELNIFKTPWGKTAITTCFDCEFPIVSQMLSKVKPEVILVPSWTSTESGLNRVDWTAKSRAIEHYAFVVKTGTVAGENTTQPHFGKATIITPQDSGFPTEVIEGVLNEASIIYSNLDLNLLRKRRKETGYFPDKEQDLRLLPIKLLN